MVIINVGATNGCIKLPKLFDGVGKETLLIWNCHYMQMSTTTRWNYIHTYHKIKVSEGKTCYFSFTRASEGIAKVTMEYPGGQW